jgi:hypothetical protein
LKSYTGKIYYQAREGLAKIVFFLKDPSVACPHIELIDPLRMASLAGCEKIFIGFHSIGFLKLPPGQTRYLAAVFKFNRSIVGRVPIFGKAFNFPRDTKLLLKCHDYSSGVSGPPL